MLAKGNGDKKVCINNLINIFRGETPLDRAIGLNREFVGKPSSANVARFVIDTKQMLQKFEKRCKIDNITIRSELEKQGMFDVQVEMSNKETE